MSFLEILAQQKIINRYQMDDILEKAGENDGDIDSALVAVGIDEDLIRQAKSQYFNIPEIVLEPDSIQGEALKYIPEDAVRHYRVIPFNTDENGTVQVAMVDPSNVQTQTALQFIFSKTKMPYTVFVISLSNFNKVMESYSNFGQGIVNDSIGTYDDSAIYNLEEYLDGASGVEQNFIVEDSPIKKTVAIIIRNAIDGGASDIHIEHSADNVKVRFRVDGELHTSYTLPREAHNSIIAVIKGLAKIRLDEKRKPQDNRFYASVDGRKVDFRVSTFPTFFGEKVVIRILDAEKGIKELEQTGMNKGHLEVVRRTMKRPYGIILITGPTGSGKSTTVYSMLNEMDREHRNIVSLEDPVEYNIIGVNQSQVRPEIDYTFANGLRSILRQDPDIIFVGEIRDKETAQLAIQAALTGHLVISTLHTNTAIGAVPRLIDMGVDPYLIAPTLILTIAQRLVKCIATDAGHQVPITDSIRAMLDKQFVDLPSDVRSALPLTPYIYEANITAGAPGGTHGRMAVYEALEIDSEIQRMILNKPNEQDIYEFARGRGMLTMKEDALLKCMQGLIPWSEVNTL
ncbi:hypothetical protein A2997_02550 [Candidatus Nomurabacteria bacterium RIFCSPLOWO2_01_FULL_36_10b]|uniref:AAA+ ATPase domain-containing protein n=1 Tax=Candidatus Nomurabacteria bacterium RIFCSPLOWO2_01_FULL_36_10b TaxID=1801766 RepID=A0A1F6WNA0_9BACT|nr:MAG: hypothetical protein A2997_02550 [Candidatus Nomurabacteria bacterium RIFCSPLOWO2_01_FULL_36_10b]